jgi:hypothetical protein
MIRSEDLARTPMDCAGRISAFLDLDLNPAAAPCNDAGFFIAVRRT